MSLAIIGNKVVCDQCGATSGYYGIIPKHVCKTREPRKVSDKGLGDRLERILSAVGITQERYKHLKQMVHLDPNCNCPQRKELLNRLPHTLAVGYARGGIAGAWNSATQLAAEIKEHYSQPR